MSVNSRKSQLGRYWEDFFVFVFAKIFGRNCEDFRGVRLLGFWALGRRVYFSFSFRRGPLFYKSKSSDHREVVGVRPP
eukprot:scaffold1228_cov115-Isochrysis_galbana.AAC.1